MGGELGGEAERAVSKYNEARASFNKVCALLDPIPDGAGRKEERRFIRSAAATA